MTLGEYAERWLAEARLGLSPGSIEHYETVIRLYLTRTLGNRDLAELDPTAWRMFTRELLGRLGANTVQLVLTVARLIYGFAALPVPLAEAAQLVRLARRQIRQPCPLTRDESERLVAALLHIAPPDYALYVLLLARTGVRPGEGAAVRIGDIEVLSRRLRIERSYTRCVVGPTKSKRPRVVDLSAGLAELLTVAIRGRCPDGWLFPGQFPDRPRNTSNYRAYLKLALAVAGLPKTHHLHCCRHGWATTLLEEGLADLFYVQRQLGHATIATTCDLYARHAHPRNLQAVDALDGRGDIAVLAALHGEDVPPVALRRVRQRWRRS